MEQDHKRWEDRRHLIVDELARLNPDVFCMNEVCIPRQTGRWLQEQGGRVTGNQYSLAQQSRPGDKGLLDGEGLLTRFPIVETANLDYRIQDGVAQVARLQIDDRLIDVYVTHLFRSTGEDSVRLAQVERLLEWISGRNDVDAKVVCGDFNATMDMPSAALMATQFSPTQTAFTAFTPLADVDGEVSHADWQRFDRCIDYIWASGSVTVVESGVCFNQPSTDDPTLYPSDHAGVWADLEFV